ncbi:RDD family protein [Streptomyces sp. NPDC006879]|uniref:RDD family protein n=1 Tax=Streptomyces sp. NPDC006879 TaxID=3364767 RepID=UPI00367FD5EE
MSTDQPRPGESPEDDPFLKKPPDQTPPSGGSPYGSPPPGTPPPGGPAGPASGGGAGGGFPPPPPPPPGGGPYGGDPYGGGPGSYGAPDPLAGMPPLAHFGKRLLARIIDVLLIAIPLYLIQLPFEGNRFVIESNNGEDATEVFTRAYNGSGLLWTLIAIVAYIGYDTLMVKRNGQTLGKRWLGLRVAMLNDGTVPPTNASLSRAAMLWLPALLCCPCIWELVLIITILADRPYRQGLHDKVGKTVVVTVVA